MYRLISWIAYKMEALSIKLFDIVDKHDLKEIGKAYKKLFEEMEKAEKEKDEEVASIEVDIPTEPETKTVKEVTTATPYVEPSPANQPPTMNNKKKFFNKKKNTQTEMINEAKV